MFGFHKHEQVTRVVHWKASLVQRFLQVRQLTGGFSVLFMDSRGGQVKACVDFILVHSSLHVL